MKATATTLTVPFNALFLSSENARRVEPGSIASLAASLLAVGQVQNLSVVRDAENPERLGVIAGGRRFRAFAQLVSEGKIADDHPVAVTVRDASEATLVSLTENVEREAMHPADEFAAFSKMREQDYSIDRIADAFGVTPLVVERRLALAGAAPELMELFRQDEISTEQLVALCTTDDHALQVKTWNEAPSWNRQPHYLRRLLTSGEVDASTDSRVAFIGGVAAYEAAGGTVRRDLFCDAEAAGFLTDVPLLEKLVADKMESHAQELRDAGWGWVEVWPSYDWQAFNRLGRVQGAPTPLTDEQQAAVAALQAESEKLEARQEAIEDAETMTDADSDELDTIQNRLIEIDDAISDIEATQGTAFAPEVMAHAGAVVTLDNGRLRIEQGLVRTADRKAIAEVTKTDVAGGRETESAGRKPNALPDSMRRSLLGRRNHAVQLATAANPRVAKVLLALQMIDLVEEKGRYSITDPAPSALAYSEYGGTRTGYPVLGDDAEAMKGALLAQLAEVLGTFPKGRTDRWDALEAMSDAELDAIIAYGVAASVTLDESHKGLTARLLGALGFDMAAVFTPTAGNYFGRLTKPVIVEGLKDAGKAEDAEQLASMKKGDLAAEAERRIAGTGWVPKLIRTPAPKGAKAAKPAPKKAAAKKAAKPAAKAKTTKGKG